MISGIDYLHSLLTLTEKVDVSDNGKIVDIFSLISVNQTTIAVEATIAAFLLLNGFQVNLIYCSGAIPSCEFSAKSEKRILGKRFYNSVCRKCINNTKEIKKIRNIKSLNIIDLSNYSKSTLNNKDIVNSNHSLVASKRALMVTTVDLKKKEHKEVHNSLQFSLNQYSNLLENYFSKTNSYFSIFIHGIYLLHGPLVDFLSYKKKKFIIWGTCYRESSIVYGINNRSEWNLAKISYEEMINKMKGHYNKEIVNQFSKKLIQRRNEGKINNLIKFNLKSDIKYEWQYNKKPTISIFTNALWDADVWYKNILFECHRDFISAIVNSSKDYSNINFVFCPHPVEGTSSFKENETIENLISSLTDFRNQENLFITNKLDNSYSLAEKSDVSFIYGGSIGAELAALGHLVYAFANPPYINKGIVRSIKSIKDYNNLIFNISNRKFDGILKNQVQKSNDFIYYQNHFSTIYLPNLPKNLNASDQLFLPPDLSTIKSIQKSNLKKMIDEIISQ